MKRALEWCDQQGSKLVALYTNKPDLYSKYGFQVVPEHKFVGVPPTQERSNAVPRRLSLHRDEDVTLLQSLLASRTPVSFRAALVDQKTMFLLNIALNPSLEVAYLAEMGVAIVFQHDLGGCFRLIDVVGPIIPSLKAILGGLGITATRTEVWFPTDRLDWVGAPQRCDRKDSLMVKGELPAALLQPFMLPPTASF